jgi:hypothetical protein
MTSEQTSAWVSTSAMAKELGIATRTLTKFRDSGQFLDAGRHYRRSTPSPQAPWHWHRELTLKAWAAEVGE